MIRTATTQDVDVVEIAVNAVKNAANCEIPVLIEKIFEGDTGPCFEAILDQNIYAGIWRLGSSDSCVFEVDLNTMGSDSDKDNIKAVWLEDGETRGEYLLRAIFPTFADAFNAISAAMMEISKYDGFDRI